MNEETTCDIFQQHTKRAERANKTSEARRIEMKRDPKDRPQISPFINLPSYKLNKSFYLTRLYTRSKDVVTQVEDS